MERYRTGVSYMFKDLGNLPAGAVFRYGDKQWFEVVKKDRWAWAKRVRYGEHTESRASREVRRGLGLGTVYDFNAFTSSASAVVTKLPPGYVPLNPERIKRATIALAEALDKWHNSP